MSNIIGSLQSVQLFKNFDALALNPQPLPPKESGKPVFDPGGPVFLNPQPLPPKALAKLFGSLFGSRMLNPQPLPPKALDLFINQASSTLDEVALNPQPLPPDPPPDSGPLAKVESNRLMKEQVRLAQRALEAY